ncbi:hypothetical protein BGX38DRAFT_1264756 [Terfezia claveryi]|nr:hypothetical protein BGX38DRAFT_1264756 [Terfezia claveryi]
MRPSMNFLGALVLALRVSSVVALVPQGQGKVSPSTPSYDKGPDSGKKQIIVTVAKTAHRYNPEVVNATIGDVIKFEFYPTTHSVTLADYKAPCVPWSAYHIGAQDVWSGLITEKVARTNPQTWTWRVDTNDPRFFYCSSAGSCAGWGMVFAVNPSADQTFATFQANAKNADYEMSPGQTAPPEGPPTNTSGSKSLSTGAIVGIIIGAIAAVALVGLLFFLIGRSRRKSASEKAAATAAATPFAQPAVDSGPAPGAYGDHPPPEYYGQRGPSWEGKGLAPPAPPLSPVHSQFNPHASMYGSPSPTHPHNSHASMYGSSSPTHPHTSWVPSELGGESTVQPQRVEIYTPGVDDRIPLNNPPKSP